MFNVKSTRDWVTEANNKANVIRSFFTQGYCERLYSPIRTLSGK